MATMSAERMCGALATVSAHSIAAPATPVVSMAGLRRRSFASVGAMVAETTRFGGRKALVGGSSSSSSSLVCRSAVRPLSDTNGNVVEFQSEGEFDTILSKAGEKLVVVDISTTTCGPCKMIFPKLVEMSLEYPDAVFLKINGNINSDTRSLMRKWNVRAVPKFIFFKKGEQVHSHTGAKLDELKKRFAEHYGQPINV